MRNITDTQKRKEELKVLINHYNEEHTRINNEIEELKKKRALYVYVLERYESEMEEL
jgi:chromosome segregation ATPase